MWSPLLYSSNNELSVPSGTVLATGERGLLRTLLATELLALTSELRTAKLLSAELGTTELGTTKLRIAELLTLGANCSRRCCHMLSLSW